MQLVRAHITNYRSVEDSGEFAIEPDVTCLVGKNESGKTAGLQALYRLNPVDATVHFDEVIDFPSRLTRQRKQTAGEEIPAATATFRLADDEIATIEADLGAGALTGPEITVTTGYRSGNRTFGICTDQAAIVGHLAAQLDIALGAHQPVAEASTVASFLAALQALSQPSASVTNMITRITGWRDQKVDLYMLDQYLEPWLPKFVYFGDYDVMPGSVSIPDLLAYADASPEEFLSPDRHERLIRELENTSNALTDEVFQYWSQNQELEVQLDILPVEPGATPPLDQCPILQVRVRNLRHRVSVPFDERSRGFVWFFSFLAYFTNL